MTAGKVIPPPRRPVLSLDLTLACCVRTWCRQQPLPETVARVAATAETSLNGQIAFRFCCFPGFALHYPNGANQRTPYSTLTGDVGSALRAVRLGFGVCYPREVRRVYDDDETKKRGKHHTEWNRLGKRVAYDSRRPFIATRSCCVLRGEVPRG